MEKKEKTVLALRLRALRRNADLTQAQMAAAVGVERSAWSYYENGVMPKLAVLNRIAAVFKVPLSDLLDHAESPALSLGSDDKFVNDNDISLFQQLSDEEKMLILKFRTASEKEQEALLKALKTKQK